MQSKRTRLVNGFLVGCDPEFIVLGKTGQTVPVDSVLRADGRIGYDHGGRIAEVRPEPCKGTWTLTKRIKKLLLEHEKAASLVALGRWRAGAHVNGDALGGHIHFGIEYGSMTRGQIIAGLDNVFQLLEKCGVLPAEEMEARRKTGYGKWGDFRPSNDGTRFEYRAAPSWLYDPKVAFLCLTVGKLAAVNPDVAARVTGGYEGLKDWVGGYARGDVNAERLGDMMETAPMGGDVEADLRKVWGEWDG